MIRVEDAVEAAIKFAQCVLETSRTHDILLEEVEPSSENGDEVWLITLSLPDPTAPLPRRRQYKTFTIDGKTGDVRAMKIRQFTGVT